MEAQIYRECVRYYPFVLGAQPVRPIDLAAFYAAIANEGVRPEPHVIDTIERNGLIIYRHDPASAVTVGSVDRAAFYQLKTMLQGVLAARHGALDGGAGAVRRRQDRHHRQRERRLVRGLHQRRHRGGVGRLRQRRRQAAHARRRRHRRPHRGADLRADHAGGVGACRAQDRAGAAVARSQAPALVQVDRSRDRARPSRRDAAGKSITECFRIDRTGQIARHPISAGVARGAPTTPASRATAWRRIRSHSSSAHPSSRSPATTTSAATMATTRMARGAIFRRRAIRRRASTGRRRSTAAIRGSRFRRRAIRMDASIGNRSASIRVHLGPSAILKDIHDAQP